ncbi:MAG TPA: GTP cyclohydrolase II [Candidatus Saccharimonadales bacterium]|nr:GTP cyclohydrolase II [Candidatus Saccharimonadales bacterium]
MRAALEAPILAPWPMVRAARVHLPSDFGDFRLYGYESPRDGKEHLAIVKEPTRPVKNAPWLVRIHSECLTGDALRSRRCDCGPQLEMALRRIEAEGRGVVVYLQQEGRGIGLLNKLRAYALQERGLDTVDANERLGFPADARDYGPAAGILADLGIRKVRLLSNNPSKIEGLEKYGVTVVSREPIEVRPSIANARYLFTKRARLGHLLGLHGGLGTPGAPAPPIPD